MSIKCCLLGDTNVGKTSLLCCKIHNQFNDQIPNSVLIGEKYSISIEVDGKQIDMNVWDTAGQEQYRTLPHLTLRDSKIIILCFAINDEESFRSLSQWLNLAHEVTEPDLIYIVGTKNDLSQTRTVDENAAIDYASQFAEGNYIECSALTGCNVSELFFYIAKKYVEKHPEMNICSEDDLRPISNKSKCSC